MKDILIKKLVEFGSKEEKYNFSREYLQEFILQIIDRNGYFKNLAFVGGTAMRIIYDLRRFSEDLDFSLINDKGFVFSELLKTVKNELDLSGYSIEETKGRGKTLMSEFIRFKGLLYEMGLSQNKKEKLFIKLEIDSNPPEGYETDISLINKNFLFKVQSFKLDSLFALKLHAVLFRKYAKGRDFYDLLWFLTKKTPVNYTLLSNAASQTEKRKISLEENTAKELLFDKINKINFTHLINDVRVFLENGEDAKLFKKEYFINSINKYFEPGGL